VVACFYAVRSLLHGATGPYPIPWIRQDWRLIPRVVLYLVVDRYLVLRQ